MSEKHYDAVVKEVARIARIEGYNQALDDVKEKLMEWGMPEEIAEKTVRALRKALRKKED